MKIYATYGLTGALLGALQTLALFLFGLHGDRIHLLNDWKVWLPLMILGLVISVVIIVLGMKAWRTESGPKGMSYGRGLGVGLLIGVWQGLGTMVFTLVYGLVINPGFKDAMIANQVAQMEAKGTPQQAIEMAEKIANFTMNPIFQAVMAVPGTAIWTLLVSLVVAAFLKRAAVEEPFVDAPPAVPPAA